MISEQVDFLRHNSDSISKVSCRCHHPQRVFNKYVGEYLYVPCRKCDACLVARSTELSLRVQNECKQHIYSIFFTLTYDDEHLPVMRYHSGNLFLGNKPVGFDSSTGNFVYPSVDVSDYKDFDLDKLLPYNSQYTDGFAYACKYDIQKFIMRLRSHIDRSKEFKYTRVAGRCVRFLGSADYIKSLSKDEKKIRFFITSEYGPKHFRPHYHGIVWTDSQPIARYLLRNILEDWSQCDKSLDKPSLVNGSAPQYVAKYVNGSTRLPSILQSKLFKSFLYASKNPIIGSFKNDMLQISDALVNGVVEQLQPVNRGDSAFMEYVPLSSCICARFFPKCQGWRFTDDFGKLAIIEKYRKRKAFPKRLRVFCSDKKRQFVGSSLYGRDYLNCTLAFKYQDSRFVRMAEFWCNRPVHYPERVNGLLTGRVLSITLSYEDYVRLLNRLYSNLALLVLRGFYYSQIQSEFYFNTKTDYLYNLFSYYPNIFFELPYTFDEDDFLNSRFGEFFDTFDFGYSDFYDDGYLNMDILSLINNNKLHVLCRNDDRNKVINSLKNKVLNEKFNF